MKRTSLSAWSICIVLILMLSVSALAVANWAPNTAYAVGALVMYNGVEYQCIQAHTSEVGWEPPNAPALWQPVSGTPGPTPTAQVTPTSSGGGGCTATAIVPYTKVGSGSWQQTASVTISGSSSVTFGPQPVTTTGWSWTGPNGYTSTSRQITVTIGSTSTYTATYTNSGGCKSSQKFTVTVSSSGGGGGGTGSTGKIFAPYIDMSSPIAENLASVKSASGISLFSAAFIVGSGCTPQWGGMYVGLTGNMNNGQSFPSNIDNLKSAGGDIILSNGGALGSELADSCLNVSSTQSAYQSEVSTFHLKYIDFDIETSQSGVDVRSQAVAALEKANPGLVVSVTLPVLPSGLVQNGLNVVSSANKYGMRIDTVNVMAMDYGSAVDNGGQMGLDAEDAASATHSQTGKNIGITPMVGVNDTSTEVFSISDANSLLSWAKGQSYVNRLSYWSVGRDNGGCAGAGYASATCSGISQSDYEFAHIFEAF